MDSTYVFIIGNAILFLLFYAYWRGLKSGIFTMLTRQNTNNRATVFVPQKSDILKHINKESLFTFSKYLKQYIHKCSPEELTRYSLRVFADPSNHNKDMMRVLTAAAAWYGFPLPQSLVLIDNKTAFFYQAIESEMEMVSPHDAKLLNNNLNLMLDCPPVPEAVHMETVGIYLLKAAQSGSFASLEHAKPVLDAIDKQAKLQVDQLKSLLTAYAYIGKFQIPKCYVSYDILTMHLIAAKSNKFSVKEKVRHLSIVK